jgi:hypothetical protein
MSLDLDTLYTYLLSPPEPITARLPFASPSAEYARTPTTLRRSEDRARAQRNLAQAYSSGTAGVGGTHTHNTHGGVDPPS